jgi:hypothetical protein
VAKHPVIYLKDDDNSHLRDFMSQNGVANNPPPRTAPPSQSQLPRICSHV